MTTIKVSCLGIPEDKFVVRHGKVPFAAQPEGDDVIPSQTELVVLERWGRRVEINFSDIGDVEGVEYGKQMQVRVSEKEGDEYILKTSFLC